MNMADVREREKIAREIKKTSESIHKKHRALKTGRIEEDIALDRHFKPIIKPLQQIDSPVRAIKRQSRDDDVASKRERKEEKEEEEEEGKKTSETFRDPAETRSHDRVQQITSTPQNRTNYGIVGQCFRNDGRLDSDESSKSVANVGRSKGVASRLGSARSKVHRGCSEGNAR